eukprot:c28796_g1_i4 orf=579-1103(+)
MVIRIRLTRIFFIQMFSILSFLLFVFSECDNTKCHFPAVFNFGDSNSDTGGLAAAFGLLPPPFGMTYFEKPAGRYCDGRLAIDFIGFRFTLKACCGFGEGIYNFNRTVGCGQRVMLEGATLTYNVCKNPSVYVNWDGVHYTEAANHIVGNGIFTGNFTNPTFPAGHICDLYSVH